MRGERVEASGELGRGQLVREEELERMTTPPTRLAIDKELFRLL